MKIIVRYNINETEKAMDAVLSDGTYLKANRITYYTEQFVYINKMTNGLGGAEMKLIGDCEIEKTPDQNIMMLILKDLSHEIIYLVSSDELHNSFTKKIKP